MVVALEGGEIQINNLKTGELLFNTPPARPLIKPMKLESEISEAKFFKCHTRFMIAASTWDK